MFEMQDIIQNIESVMQDITAEMELPENFLTLNTNQNDSISLWINEPVTNTKSKMIFNIQEMGRKGNKYIRIYLKSNTKGKFNVPDDIGVNSSKSDPSTYFITISEWTEAVHSLVDEIIKYYVNDFEPSDRFGCCHLYRECSQAKKCIHDNLFYARACWYRKNLESGRIFY